MKKILMGLMVMVVTAAVITGAIILLGLWPGIATAALAAVVAAATVVAAKDAADPMRATVPMEQAPAPPAPLAAAQEDTLSKADLLEALMGVSGFPGKRPKKDRPSRHRQRR